MVITGDAVDEKTYREVCDFLYQEAELLDEERFREWLDLLTEDVDYRMPLRVTRERGAGPGFLEDMFHFEENKYRLTKRVERLESGSAWAEDPPSRTRHVVSNVRVAPDGQGDELRVTSCLILYRTRGDNPHYDILSAKREDRLRRVDGSWKLARRRILLDQSTVATHNLSIFL